MVPVWIKLVCNNDISPEEMETINYPKWEYTRYLSFQSAEFLGIFGFIRGAFFRRRSRIMNQDSTSNVTKKLIYRQMGILGNGWLVVGFLAGLVLSMAAINGRKMSEIYQMCYKIRHDESVTRRDRWSLVGGVTGGTVGLISSRMFKSGGAFTGRFCGMFGMSVGCLSSVAYSYVVSHTSDTDSKSVINEVLEEKADS